MPEESQQSKNTVALIWMICSIVGILLCLTIFWLGFGLFLLWLWFILWIIGLFSKPRGKAWVAVSIPLIVFVAIFSIIAYIRSSIKTPANEFIARAETTFEDIDKESINEDQFWDIIESKINEIFNSKTEEDRKSLYSASTWSNMIEKGSYLFFDIVKQWIEGALEEYNNLPETDKKTKNIEVSDENNETVSNNENKDNTTTSSVEVFSESEKNDIEQIISILE